MMNQLFELAYANITELFAAGSALVAITSALAAKRETRKQRVLTQERLRQSIDTAILGWGNDAIETMGRAAMFAKKRSSHASGTAFHGLKDSHLVNLSALVERGRLFFPNLDERSKGKHKDSAYRGVRPPILDCLMWTYYELDEMTHEGGPTDKNATNFIDDCRRLMVSELQAHLDPRRKDEVIGRYEGQRPEDLQAAIARSAELKNDLRTRRPSFKLGDEADKAPERKGMFQ
jgi:hypothetical protein